MKKKNILILCALLVLILSGCEGNEREAEKSDVHNQTEKTEMNIEVVEEEKVTMKFPYISEEQLEVLSLSTATMPNPDAGGEIGEDIASLEIVNKTGKYLVKAEVEVVLENGTVFQFVINDLPDEKKVQAFDINNSVYDDKILCEQINVKSLQVVDGDQIMSDAITIDVQETQVTLTNVSQDNLMNLNIVCMCDLDGSYLGGTSYSYLIDSIPAGAQITIDALDCYLGTAEVVRIIEKN